MTPDDLIAYARSWAGVPFRHQGRSRSGVDCIGFLIALFREAGALPADFRDRADYGRIVSSELLDSVQRYCVETPSARPGVLVMIQWPRHKLATHVGLLTGPTIIHSHATVGAVVEHGWRGAWRRWAHSYWRLPGVVYE